MAAEYYNYNTGNTGANPSPDSYSYTAMVMAASQQQDGSQTGYYSTEHGAVAGSYGYATGAMDYNNMYASGSFNSGSFHSSAPGSPAYASAAPVKRYTHDPYASTPSTPTSAPSQPASTNASAFSTNTSADSTAQLPPSVAAVTANTASYAPVYAPEGSYSDSVAYPVANSTADQFSGIVGNVVGTACTAKGRHLLMSVMRLQHLDKIQLIFDECLPCLHELAINQHGCHVLRTLIENLTEDQLSTMISSITTELIVELATNSQYTRRILQCMFERHKSECLDFVVNVVSQKCIQISCTQQGCIAVMRILENALPHQQRGLLEHLSPHLATLAVDAYGNYVVQSIIQNTDQAVSCGILASAFAGKWVKLARNKFASNVLEKLLRIATPTTRSHVITNLVLEKSALEEIMGDGFGNFVLQAVIETCNDQEEFRKISELVRSLLPNCPYGHKIEAKLKSKRGYMQ